MSAPPATTERPTSRRPFSWWRWSHVLLAAAAAPLFAAFAWQATVASVGDDSVSYLAMARWFAGTADAHLTPWLPWHSHFPPLFSMVLALAGGGRDLLAGHLVVAGFAALSAGLAARYAGRRLGSDRAGFWLALAFLAVPTAWISAKSILSEPMYLALSLGVLLAHERWIARDGARPGAYLAFGVLLALAYSTRAVGVTLVAAYILREAVASVSRRRLHGVAWLPVVPPILAAAAWAVARPRGDVYGQTLRSMVDMWLNDAGHALEFTARTFSGGWIASFAAEGPPSAATIAVFGALGALAFAGSVRAAARNRLDGWYVLLSAALVFFWVFGVDNMRRLLYPIVPLALMHAAEMLILAAAALRLPRPGLAVAAVAAVPLLLCAPATALIAQKWQDRAILVEGTRYSASEVLDYYRVMNLLQARALAAKHAAALGGLERLREATPPGARIMWARPEYVAVLADREGVPSLYGWDATALATHIRDAKVDYLVVSGMTKSDLDMRTGEASVAMRNAEPYVRVELRLVSPVTGEDEFLLLKVDAAALDGFLSRASPRR